MVNTMFTQISDVKAVQADIRSLKRHEDGARLIINTRCPEIAQGIHAGDNIVIVNNLLDALAGNRKKEIFTFFKAMLPYHFDKESMHFTKKFRDEDKVKTSETELVHFLKSGVTVFGWLSMNVEVKEAAPKDWELLWTNDVKKFGKHLTNAKMLEVYFSQVEGLAADDVIQIFADVAAKKAAEEVQVAA